MHVRILSLYWEMVTLLRREMVETRKEDEWI